MWQIMWFMVYSYSSLYGIPCLYGGRKHTLIPGVLPAVVGGFLALLCLLCLTSRLSLLKTRVSQAAALSPQSTPDTLREGEGERREKEGEGTKCNKQYSSTLPLKVL